MKTFGMSMALCVALAACGTGGSAPSSTQTSSAAPVLGSSGGGQLNAIRSAANLPDVRRSAVLDAAARAHASDMASKGFFGHKGSNGSTVGKRVTRAGYKWCTVAENISQGYPSRSAAIEGWRTSPGHYRNMTKRKVKEFGLANVGDYWVMVLAAKRC